MVSRVRNQGQRSWMVWLRFSNEVVGCWLGLQLCEGLTGSEGSDFKLEHVDRRPQPLTTWPFHGAVTTWQLASPRPRNSRNRVSKTKATLPFYYLVSKIAHHYFCFILVAVRSNSLSPAHTQQEEN